ncbi:hypothetical protein [Streptomyces chiangmaiensis]|uniref:Uncharacterized protein n=1 Tax=Streptomyces chiangmaiensis TaxID=766497 RepID=A0ABU7FIP1_9ACTN|nr:hypothetical protein [Streptomyces chiangmaiensis]MED7823991.1 hypothetical protein [Streptomyces chiangmaiensis]
MTMPITANGPHPETACRRRWVDDHECGHHTSLTQDWSRKTPGYSTAGSSCARRTAAP